jgi:hypothetical protein
MLWPQISGLDEFRDHLVGKRNAFVHLASPRFTSTGTAGRATSVPKATNFEGAASAARLRSKHGPLDDAIAIAD